MKIACGTDIIEIARIKKSIDSLGDRFLNTIFTEAEIEYCEGHGANRFQHYAARFAAKEALYKALSGFVSKDVLTWKNFEFVNDVNGKPLVIVDDSRIESIDVSISHCKDYAVANVVVLYNS